MGRACLQRLREEIPPPSDEVFARESREFLEDLDAFIEAECEGAHGRHPVAFEVSFGLPPVGDEDRLARAEPVTIELGDDRRLVLHGRIDRINRLDAGEYEVIDYKTGTYWPDNWEGEFAGGTRLQHALYGAAAESLLKGTDARARVVRGRYVFPSVKGHGHEKVIPAPSRAKLVRVLRDLSDVIGAGAFVPADLEQSCRWCEFAAACHVGDVGRAERKRDNPANVALEAYRRLRRDHE
jgi:ATP-dependent helicase/nuclease subunit B